MSIEVIEEVALAGKRHTAPRYMQIAAELRAGILSGEYGPGTQLPGENTLMGRFHVARETARKALAVLRHEGLTETQRGVGVFVRGFRPIRRNAMRRLAASQWGGGRSIWEVDVENRPMTTEVEVVDDAEPPDRVAKVMDLAGSARVCVRRRRYLVEDKPVMLAVSYLPAALVAGTAITRPDAGAGGIYARLKDLGSPPVHFREELRARMPLPEEANRLVLASGTPVITIARTAYGSDGSVLEVNEMTLDASRYLLEYDFSA